MKKQVDLHLHTYASDGQWSGAELIEEVDKAGVRVFAVTDHDETGCVPEVAELVKDREDLTFIRGVEGTVTYLGIEHHILTYGIDVNDLELQACLAHNRQVRNDFNGELMTWLSDSYPQVSRADYESYEYNPYQGGWRAYGYLMDRGVIFNLQDYFAKTDGYHYEKKFLKPEDYIPKMVAKGYKVILAHPPAYTDSDIYEEAHLDYFRELGLSGIECYSRYLKEAENSRYYLDYCRHHNLIVTGGSDCHGGFAKRKLGRPYVDDSMVDVERIIS